MAKEEGDGGERGFIIPLPLFFPNNWTIRASRIDGFFFVKRSAVGSVDVRVLKK